MTVRATIAKSMSMANGTFNSTATVEADAVIFEDVSVPAGFAGTLTARGSDSAGTVTTTNSHTITTGVRADVYWTGGCRRGVTVGTVNVKAIPISGGSGDALPLQTTDILIVEPLLLDMAVLGTNVDCLMLYAAKRGQFVFVDDNDAELHQVELPASGSWAWSEDDGFTNPITGDTVAGVYVSHGDAAAATMRVGILYNN